MKVAIVDYGMGNIHSLTGCLKHLGAEVILTDKVDELQSADKIILPGVGSFRVAMERIVSTKLDVILSYLALERKMPFLGICLGMQLMGSLSDEDGLTNGLAFIKAPVRRFERKHDLKIPHVGFNQVSITKETKLFKDLKHAPDFYFTHSHRMTGANDANPSLCEYGGHFVAAFEKENVAGVQFHPELSQSNGLILMRNFLDRF